MPDRGSKVSEVTYHFFGDNNYCGVTGWPNMIQTVTHDGWMGIAPQGREITMRSLDFWRIEDGKIRENWVLVDLLDAYRQLGVDVFAPPSRVQQGAEPRPDPARGWTAMKARRGTSAEAAVPAGVGRSTLGRIFSQDLGEHRRASRERAA